MISGGSLVRKDVPPYIKVAKEPLKFLGINIVGLKRKGFSENDIYSIKNIYRNIFGSGKNILSASLSVMCANSKSVLADSKSPFENCQKGDACACS